MTRDGSGLAFLVAAATIFAGALLLFEVEPLIAKAILPWFGGSAQVWTTCLLFFQAALLAGYLYAHVLSTRAGGRWQIRIHVALLVASLALLPIVPSAYWKPAGGEPPIRLILGLLATTVGLPFALLSSTGPLVQAWLARRAAEGAKPPYRLYALSNLGSMLALLSYPALVEPNLALKLQENGWSLCYAGFAVLAAATAWLYRSGEAPPAREAAGERPSWLRRALWFGLAAAASALLLAMTNYMLQNVAAIPLFWIVPLALYLLSFVFAFNNLRWYVLPHWYIALAFAVGALFVGMGGRSEFGDLAMMPVLAAALFVFCIVCHSELSLLKPGPRHLTEYYLILSAGGAAGGLFVAVIAPMVFDTPYELRIIVPAALVLAALAGAQHFRAWAEGLRGITLLAGAAVLVAVTVVVMAALARRDLSGNIVLARNFYGALRVREVPIVEGGRPVRVLMNGSILHGAEFSETWERRQPLSYYAEPSGIGLLLGTLEKSGPLRVGVIGLGVGTIAAYGRPGDDYTFYEINPLVETIARRHFWYLALDPATSRVVLGDGRLSLEREPPQNFDILAVDAFTSDSIPMHLLTRQAFALYWRHLKPDGILAVHVSNRFADLAPVVAEAAAADGKAARLFVDEADLSEGRSRSMWMLVTARPGFFDRPPFRAGEIVAVPPHLRAWTDDYSNIWSVVHF